MGELTIRPCNAVIGAEVDGVDLAQVSDDEFAAIDQALLDHQVLFFHDQDLTDDQHLAFAGRFGEPSIFPVSKILGGDTRLQYIEDNADSPPDADDWHTDVTWIEEPPQVAVLSARVIPEVGGDTMWSSLTAAYEALSPTMQEVCAGLTVRHHRGQDFDDRVGRFLDADQMRALDEGYPAVEHPLVRTHPRTGRQALFLSGVFMQEIVGMTPAESEALMGFLLRHGQDPNFQVRWRWRADDLADLGRAGHQPPGAQRPLPPAPGDAPGHRRRRAPGLRTRLSLPLPGCHPAPVGCEGRFPRPVIAHASGEAPVLHPLDRRTLRRHFTFATADEAISFVAAMARRSTPGMAVAVCLDDQRRLLDFRPVEDGADHLADVLRFVEVLGHRRTRAVLLLTDRTGDALADRPDDELVWEELVGQATAAGLVLLDWWVMFGTQAFSVAEHAPTPCGLVTADRSAIDSGIFGGMPPTIDGAGRVVIPKAIREDLGLRAGTAITVEEVEGHIEIRPVPTDFDLVDTGEGLVAHPRGPIAPLTDDIVRETLDRVRRR